MNNIYRVIWNKSTQTWQAVSEFAKGKSKSASSTVVSDTISDNRINSKIFILTGIASSLLLVANPSLSATGDLRPDQSNVCYFDTASNSVICGDSTTSNGSAENTVAVGIGSQTLTNNSVSIGNGAGKANADFGTAAGDVANGNRTAVANLYTGGVKNASPESVETHTNTSIGKDAGSYGAGKNNVAMGTGAGVYQQGEDSIAIGTNANNYQVNGMSDHAINRTVGNGTKNSNAINRSRYSVAIGRNAMTYDDHSVAVGDGAKALRNGSVAIGKDAKAITHYQTAGGAEQKMSAIAIGEGATAALGGDITIGINSGSKVNQNTTPTTNMFAPQNITMGNSSGDNVYGWTNTVFGSNSGKNIGTSEKPNYANTAFGYGVGNNIRGDNNVNIGYLSGSNIFSNSNTSVGTRVGSHVSGANNVTTGYGSGNRVSGGGNWSAGLQAGNNIGVLENNATLDVNTNTFKVGQDNAKVSGSNNNVAAGKNAGSNIAGSNNIAFGENAGIYVGNDKTALSSSNHNAAIGSKSGQYIKGNYNTAIGYGAGAGADGDILDRTRSLSQGYQATAYTNDSIAVGSDAKAGTKGSKTAVNAIAIGTGAQATAKDSISIGTGNVVSGQGSGAIGDQSTVSGNESYSLGNNNNIAQDNTFVVGNDVTTTQANSVVLGNDSTDREATAESEAQVGNLTYQGFAGQGSVANGVVSVGDSSKERQIINVAAGKISADSTDAINGSQLYAVADILGEQVSNTYFHVNTGANDQGEGDSTTNLGKITDKAGATAKGAITAGEKAKASGLSSTAIGFNALATGVNSVAVGSNTKALGDQTVAIGYNTGDKATVAHRSTFIGADAGQNSNGTPQATGLQEGYNVYIGDGAGKAAVGTHNTAVGSASTGAGVVGDINVAFGHAALYNTKGNENAGFGAYAGQNSSGINNTAIGAHAGRRVTGDNNTALGNNAGTGVTANQTVSLGAAAKATHDKAVALGAGSTTSAAVGTREATVNGITYSTFYGTNPVATVSVGSNTEKRTITNVAAGRINATSTDAINGSQLYLTQDRLGNVANAVVNNFGGNATLNPNKQGDITFTNIGDTGKDNIHDAIKAATTKVKGDKGVTVISEVSATDGSTTYTVSATTGNITTDDKGNATTDMPNALTTVKNVVDAINASGFTLTAQGENGSLVKPGSTVDMKNTDGNIVISKSADNNDVVYNLAKDITVDSVKAGDTTINNDGLTITGGPSVTKIGIDAASNKITNVAAGEADTDAVNVSQLKDAQQVNQAATTWKVNTEASSDAKSVSNQTVTVNHGINTKVSEVKQDADGNYSYEIDVTGLPMEYVDAKGNTLVNVGGKFYSQKEGNNGELVLTPSTPAKVRISSDKPMQLTNVDKGEISATSTDAVNGSQLHETNQNVANNTANIAKNKAEIDKGLDFAGDKGEFNRKLGQKTTVKGGITDESKLSNNNIGVIAKDGTLEVKLAKDIKVDSVTTGNTVINNDGVTIAAPTKDNPKNTVSLSSSGLNNGGNRITNVAPGVDGTDAVNVNQLKGVANNLNNRMHKVDKNLRAGIAGALASGDLPQPYLPGKSMIALGGGSYRGESAIAIGASRNSDNGKWIIKGSANTDSRGHVGVSGSVGYQF